MNHIYIYLQFVLFTVFTYLQVKLFTFPVFNILNRPDRPISFHYSFFRNKALENAIENTFSFFHFIFINKIFVEVNSDKLSGDEELKKDLK